MKKIQYGVPAIALGMVLVGGGSALAFGPAVFVPEAFSSFSTEEQAAIERAYELRVVAHDEAEEVLEEAGIDHADVRAAMQAYQGTQRTARQEAIEHNDYAAFAALATDHPMGGTLSEADFAKMVEMHELQQAGKYEEARQIREELSSDGVRSFGMGKEGGRGARGMHGGFGKGQGR